MRRVGILISMGSSLSRSWPVGRCAGMWGRKIPGLSCCQEVLIPGTRHCAGTQPRDEVMKDRTVTPGAVVSQSMT